MGLTGLGFLFAAISALYIWVERRLLGHSITDTLITSICVLFFVIGPHPFKINVQKYTISSLSLALIFLCYIFTIKGPWSTIQDLQHRLQHRQSSVLDTDKQDHIYFYSTTTTPARPVKTCTVITVNKPTISDDPFLLASILSINTTILDAITSPNGVYRRPPTTDAKIA